MKESQNKICILGLGYIGLPTAALLATKGYTVHGVDIREDVVKVINAGEIHIQEPDLDVFVKSAVQSGNLTASLAVEPANIFIIAVPTPFKKGFSPDLKYVHQAARTITPFLKEGNLIIVESTCPVGSTEGVAELIFQERPDLKNCLHIAHCPERVLPGQIMYELVHNDRLVGGVNQAATREVALFYRKFVSGEVVETNARTAEMAKLSENIYRDVNIALANELSIICATAGIDVGELIALANRHPRVNFLQPGCGVGGHCIAVDPWFLIDSYPTLTKLIKTARERNREKTTWVIEKILSTAESIQKDSSTKVKVACMGLSYKPDVDDLRESPAMEIVRELQRTCKVKVLPVEPHISSHPDIELFDSLRAFEEADLIVYLVNHKLFKNLPLDRKHTLNFTSTR
tara:strand:+ start:1942 stop:3150 length:1209 start_codon:yes stop_codon:yes gene_type:complete